MVWCHYIPSSLVHFLFTVLQYEHGDEESQAEVNKMMPKKVKKRKKITMEDGVSAANGINSCFGVQNLKHHFIPLQSDAGWEEYHDYIFPDDETAAPNLKLLSMAKMWKSATQEDEDDSEGDSSDGEAPEPSAGTSGMASGLDFNQDRDDSDSSTSSESESDNEKSWTVFCLDWEYCVTEPAALSVWILDL